MSYNTWHDYGYGICTDDINIDSVDRIEELLSFAPKFQEEINRWFKEQKITVPTIQDYLDFADDNDGFYGIAFILREVIKEAECVELYSCDNFDGFNFLIYMPRYPWNMTDIDRCMTEEKLNEMLDKYVGILSDQFIDIDYQEVGNGG